MTAVKCMLIRKNETSSSWTSLSRLVSCFFYLDSYNFPLVGHNGRLCVDGLFSEPNGSNSVGQRRMSGVRRTGGPQAFWQRAQLQLLLRVLSQVIASSPRAKNAKCVHFRTVSMNKNYVCKARKNCALRFGKYHVPCGPKAGR